MTVDYGEIKTGREINLCSSLKTPITGPSAFRLDYYGSTGAQVQALTANGQHGPGTWASQKD